MTKTAVRASGMYAVFEGKTYPARWNSDTPAKVVIDGPGSDVRVLEQYEIDRLYKVRVTCAYRGGGPFFVVTVERVEGRTILYVQYLGDDREWALAQPKIASIEAYRESREADVYGWIDSADAEFLREDVEDLPIRRRRPKATPA